MQWRKERHRAPGEGAVRGGHPETAREVASSYKSDDEQREGHRKHNNEHDIHCDKLHSRPFDLECRVSILREESNIHANKYGYKIFKLVIKYIISYIQVYIDIYI